MDLPPFCIAQCQNEICGLNIVGLRRAGVSAEERLELKRLYHALFRSGKNLRGALAAVQNEFTSSPAKTLMEFVASAKRGVCTEVGAGGRTQESK
jgi:UDP-N-acetylglucosamine acyltransferase